MGLMPANLGNRQRQIDRAWAAVGRCATDLDKYQVSLSLCSPAVLTAIEKLPQDRGRIRCIVFKMQALMLLRDTQSDLFLALAAEHIEDILPLL